MTLTSYAQNYEDVLLRRALSHVSNGTYIDVGAQDPVTDSVSLCFYQAGWRGIHVEPTPAYAARLRSARPDETVIEAAVSTSAGPLPLFEIPDTGLSTASKSIAERHGSVGYTPREILVPTVRLAHLLDLRAEVHWLKIDVEGMEADVIASWDDQPSRPWIVVVEATAPNSQERTDHQWRDDLLRRDYQEVHFDGLSRYFVHRDRQELAAAFAAPPNIFDDFQVTGGHFSTRDLQAQTASAANELERALRAEVQAQADTLHGVIATMKGEAAALRTELDGAQAAHLSAARLAAQAQADLQASLEASIKAEQRQSETLDRLWAERRASEESLRAQLYEAESAHADRESAFEAELADARQQAAELDGTIQKALAQPLDRWQRLGLKLGFSRPDGARRVLSARRTPQEHQPETRTPEPPMHFATSEEARNPYLRADSLDELLSWADVNFVRCAFVTMLGRQPDPKGELYYLDRLRRGRSKLELIWQLRRSAEGQRHDPGIAGLDRALRRAAWERKPVTGRLVRLFTKGEPDDRLARLERALANDMAIIKAAVSGTVVTTSGPNRGGSPISISNDGGGNGDPFEDELQIASGLSPAKEQAFLVLTGFAAR